jgi:proteasome lid subunit RPN8/RPN11
VVLDPHWLMVLEHDLRLELPQEGCALLLGSRQGKAWVLHWVWPCLNRWQPQQERTKRFAVDPAELVAAQKWARQKGWLLLGAAHSHPRGPAQPSPTDCEWAWEGALMVIWAVEAGFWGTWWMEPTPGGLRPRALDLGR